MRRLLECILAHAAERPDDTALVDEQTSLSYGQLQHALARAASTLRGTRVATMIDNGIPWAVVDLALTGNRIVSIPIPPFFTEAQVRHLINDADPDLILTDQPERIAMHPGVAAEGTVKIAGRELFVYTRVPTAQRTLPAETSKITYTSGTTGDPKGVCLDERAIEAVTFSLVSAVEAEAGDRSLALLPLSTLLENIGGLYAPLLSGATAILPSLAVCGFSGSSRCTRASSLPPFIATCPPR